MYKYAYMLRFYLRTHKARLLGTGTRRRTSAPRTRRPKSVTAKKRGPRRACTCCPKKNLPVKSRP